MDFKKIEAICGKAAADELRELKAAVFGKKESKKPEPKTNSKTESKSNPKKESK